MPVDTTIVSDNVPSINPRGAMLFDLSNLSLCFDDDCVQFYNGYFWVIRILSRC